MTESMQKAPVCVLSPHTVLTQTDRLTFGILEDAIKAEAQKMFKHIYLLMDIQKKTDKRNRVLLKNVILNICFCLKHTDTAVVYIKSCVALSKKVALYYKKTRGY